MSFLRQVAYDDDDIDEELKKVLGSDDGDDEANINPEGEESTILQCGNELNDEER